MVGMTNTAGKDRRAAQSVRGTRMSTPTFQYQCRLLAQISGDFEVDSADKQAWSDFLRNNEIGLLIALVFRERLVEPASDSAMEIIESTYVSFCEVLGLDPCAQYGSLKQAIEASPIQGSRIGSGISARQVDSTNPRNASPVGTDALDVANASLSRVNVRRIAQLTGFDLETVTDAVGGDPFAQNNVGNRLMDTTEVHTGLMFLVASAHQGLPWAVSNFTWHCLQTEQFERAGLLFEATQDACETFVWIDNDDADEGWAIEVRQQWANSRSNDALRSLAMDEDPTYALDVWADGATTGHPESLFYPALVDWKSGHRERARSRLLSLDRDTLHEMRQILTDVTRSAGGWFRAWCTDGLQMLAELEQAESSPAQSGSAAPMRSFCGYCGVRREKGNIFCTACGTEYD